MKALTLILLTFWFNSILSQDIAEWESIKQRLTNDIKVKEDSLKIINGKIKELKTEEIIRKSTNKEFQVVIRKGGKLMVEADMFADISKTYTAPTAGKVLDFKNSYYFICVENDCGYISSVWLENVPEEMLEYETALKEKEFQANKIARQKRWAEANERIKLKKEEDSISLKLKEEKLIKKYGKSKYEKLKNGEIWIGCTMDMAKIAWGNPVSSNKTTRANKVSEQWVYGNGNYLYFDNGILTTIQN